MVRTLLALESSCDETSAAVVRNGVVESLVIASQKEHSAWGGVMPELASRSHVRAIAPTIAEALRKAGATAAELSAVAVTTEPGLIGSLLVGVNVAKGMAVALGIPLISVHHIEAHLLSVLLDNPDAEFPWLSLVVSGGHTLLYVVHAPGNYQLIGSTRDDAAGEAFDKGAKMLGLGYPGGPLVDQHARQGDRNTHKFPRGLLSPDTHDFSFSGLKTSLRYFLRDHFPGAPPTGQPLADLCASYQEAIVETLVEKTMRAAKVHGTKRISVVGGVSANSRLKERMEQECGSRGFTNYTIKPIHGTDNAAMIGVAGWQKFLAEDFSPLSITARASTIRADRHGALRVKG